MKIKNNQTRNAQFFFYKKKKGSEVPELDFVHIPGGATVELDDAVFKALLASQTEVQLMHEVSTALESEVPVTMEKKQVVIKEYFETGETKVVNLLQEAIDAGEFTIVERIKATMKEIEAKLTENGIDFKAMDEDSKLALYQKLV